MYSYGWFCTVVVGRRTARNVRRSGVAAVVVAAAVVVTVAVAVPVTAAGAGGQCHPRLPTRLFLLRVLPPTPAPAPPYPPLPADSPATPI